MRTVVFFDGQNLYHGARDAYDVEKLAAKLVERVPGRKLEQIRFYTGVPSPHRGPDEKFWHGFWGNKLRYLGARGIYVYRGRVNPGGQEKGVDVSLAIDLIRMTYEQRYGAAIIVTRTGMPGCKARKGNCEVSEPEPVLRVGLCCGW